MSQINKDLSHKENEFSDGASMLSEPHSRRSFIKGLAGTMALAGATSCSPIRKPEKTIIPYAKQPEYLIEGKSVYYASSMAVGNNVTGILVETFEGRPTKIEGNPDHQGSFGTTNMYAQSSILDLYDPDRLKAITHKGKEVSRASFLEWLNEQRKTFNNGENVAILTEKMPSPIYHKLLSSFKSKYPKATITEYEAVSERNASNGLLLATKKRLTTDYNFKKANVVVSFESNFLSSDTHNIKYSRDFSSRRDIEKNKNQNRLYVIEDHYSVTGGAADHRIKIRRSDIEKALYVIADRLGKELPSQSKKVLKKALSQYISIQADKYSTIIDSIYVDAIVDDLIHNKGKSILLAGPHQKDTTHALIAIINDLLSNTNKTVFYHQEYLPNYATDIQDLQRKMMSNEIETLIIIGGDPVYNTPGDLKFKKALSNVSTTLHLSALPNETSHEVNWVIPKSHTLESWGDLISTTGEHSIIQPTITPIYDSFSNISLLLKLIGSSSSSYDYVKSQLTQRKTSEDWRKWLHNGIIRAPQKPSGISFTNSALLKKLKQEKKNDPSNVIVTFQADSSVYDGRYVNNSWLQEIPDNITKITWDTAALISPKTAHLLHIKSGQLITLTTKTGSTTLPASIVPGKADNSISLFYGYGQTVSGKVGQDRGFNVFPLQSIESLNMDSVTIKVEADFYELAKTQEEDSLHDRPIYRQTDATTYAENPNVIQEMLEHADLKSLWEEPSYTEEKSPYQWGMTIDLNKCTGCNACAIACQSENNIPTVGKEEVKNGREMHWLRMDRYFEGDENNPEMLNQPMMCVHCEMAPCEQVCPVAATVHDNEGLNVMVYNRCIGTRYCSNNCPYKVRRFNFYDWHQRDKHSQTKEKEHLFDYFKESPDTIKMQKNPDVTVRMRGVMEKCTYCTQRLSEGKQRAKNQNRMLADGEVKTACQQVCASDAIVFGNILDKKSNVAKTRETERAYAVLEELNTKPRTLYLARIRNPHPLISRKNKSKATTNHH